MPSTSSSQCATGSGSEYITFSPPEDFLYFRLPADDASQTRLFASTQYSGTDPNPRDDGIPLDVMDLNIRELRRTSHGPTRELFFLAFLTTSSATRALHFETNVEILEGQDYSTTNFNSDVDGSHQNNQNPSDESVAECEARVYRLNSFLDDFNAMFAETREETTPIDEEEEEMLPVTGESNYTLSRLL